MSGSKPALALLVLAACGQGHVGDGTDDADTVACARLETGPFQTLVPSATRADPPGIESGAIAYQITGDGFVYYGALDAGDYGIYLDQPIDVAVTDPGGAAIDPVETADGSGACVEVKRRILVTLAVGPSYLELSGVGADPVSVAVEPVDLAPDAGP
jgi:hypothetical protein